MLIIIYDTLIYYIFDFISFFSVCFRGHTSFVNAAVFVKGGTHFVSASSDGSLKLWDIRTTECVLTFRCSNNRKIYCIFVLW